MSDLFHPGPENGIAARRRMQERLATSIRHVLDQCRGFIEFDEANGDTLVNLLNSPARVEPAVFGRYFEAVRRISTLEEDAPQSDEEASRAALAELLNGPFAAGETIAIRPLTPTRFTPEEERSLRGQFASESLDEEQIVVLAENLATDQTERVRLTLDLIAAHAPRTFSEMRHVIAEIILTGDAGNTEAEEFAACSSLERWGSMLINPKALAEPIDLADALMHEAAHSYLYGASPIEFHVSNPMDERYKSPLRSDPRPLDGIYHATFVLARTCFAMTEFAASETLAPSIRKQASLRADDCRRLFWDGHGVLEKHADYTDAGRAIMAAARDYMASLDTAVSA